ncbi:hypothetical protein PJL18_04429 [Paenarthrobacter nicotinovorans]|nr:hypothetical protein [Paenarthrobacter nicotinovorans]
MGSERGIRDSGGLGAGVLHNVGEGFLDDAVGGEFSSGRKGPPRGAYLLEAHLEGRRPEAQEQFIQVREPGLRACGGVLVRAQDAQEPPHFAQRVPSRGGDGGQSFGGKFRFGCSGVPCPVRLRDDHGQRVRHDVVHLPGNVGAFVGGGQFPLLQLLYFHSAGAVLEGLQLEPADSGEVTEGPAHEDKHPDQHGVQGTDGEAHDARLHTRGVFPRCEHHAADQAGHQHGAARPGRTIPVAYTHLTLPTRGRKQRSQEQPLL